jgi:hypothetical protein
VYLSICLGVRVSSVCVFFSLDDAVIYLSPFVWQPGGLSYIFVSLFDTDTKIAGVTLHWEGRSTAKKIRVSSGSTCEAVAEMLSWTNLANSSQWDYSSKVRVKLPLQ